MSLYVLAMCLIPVLGVAFYVALGRVYNEEFKKLREQKINSMPAWRKRYYVNAKKLK